MFSRLIRQRRRIGFAAVATMLASGVFLGSGPVSIMAGLAAAGLAIAILRFVPQFRQWIEAGAAGLFITSFLPLHPALSGVMIIAFAALIYLAFYASWLDRTPLRLALDSRRQSDVGWSPAQCWAALVPGEAHPDDHWTGSLVDFDHDPDDPDTLYLRTRDSDGLFDEATLTFLERDPGMSCRYLLERSEPNGGDDMTLSLSLTDISKPSGTPGCQIDTRMQQDALPVRIALARWFDDSFGDELDSFAALIKSRRDWSIRGLAVKRGKQIAA
jgi:hypothetical protein